VIVFSKNIRAKQFDALCTLAAQRNLTPAERAFVNVFSDMLNGDATEEQMQDAWRLWVNEEG
jgi:hypothetical protein